jgi:hypothetical protein
LDHPFGIILNSSSGGQLDCHCALDTHNNDSFFIINGIKGKVEFYPGTGVFICKSTGYRGKGADNMIKYAKTGQTSF